MGGCVGKPKAEEGHGSPVVKAAARAQLAPQPLFARPLYAINHCAYVPLAVNQTPMSLA